MMMMSIDMFWSSLLISDLECEIKNYKWSYDVVELDNDVATYCYYVELSCAMLDSYVMWTYCYCIWTIVLDHIALHYTNLLLYCHVGLLCCMM